MIRIMTKPSWRPERRCRLYRLVPVDSWRSTLRQHRVYPLEARMITSEIQERIRVDDGERANEEGGARGEIEGIPGTRTYLDSEELNSRHQDRVVLSVQLFRVFSH